MEAYELGENSLIGLVRSMKVTWNLFRALALILNPISSFVVLAMPFHLLCRWTFQYLTFLAKHLD